MLFVPCGVWFVCSHCAVYLWGAGVVLPEVLYKKPRIPWEGFPQNRTHNRKPWVLVVNVPRARNRLHARLQASKDGSAAAAQRAAEREEISFEGGVVAGSMGHLRTYCTVSFPGAATEQWNTLVAAAEGCGLNTACVFVIASVSTAIIPRRLARATATQHTVSRPFGGASARACAARRCLLLPARTFGANLSLPTCCLLPVRRA